jgi:hypothetical protein
MLISDREGLSSARRRTIGHGRSPWPPACARLTMVRLPDLVQTSPLIGAHAAEQAALLLPVGDGHGFSS